MRKIPPLNSLKAFDAVARNGSLSKAAAELSVSSSAISQQISILEDWMGLKFLNRSSNKTSLSPAGIQFANSINNLFDELQAGVIRAQENFAACEIKISVIPSLATRWLMNRLPHYSALHPDHRVMVETSYDLTDFNQGDISLALRSGKGQYPKCHCVELFNEYVTPACSPEYWRDHKLGLRDIGQATLLADHSVGGDETNLDWECWMAREKITPTVGLKPSQIFTDSNLTIQAAVNGAGFMLGRSILIGEEIEKGTLITPFENKQVSDWPYFIAHPSSTNTSPRIIKGFIKWLHNEAKETQGNILINQDNLSPS